VEQLSFAILSGLHSPKSRDCQAGLKESEVNDSADGGELFAK